jgi:hypothetical protein
MIVDDCPSHYSGHDPAASEGFIDFLSIHHLRHRSELGSRQGWGPKKKERI